MDVDATVAQPIATVFGHLATPWRLGDWLPAVVWAERAGGDAAFALTLCEDDDGDAVAATSDLVAYEPPWLLAYRVCVGPRVQVIRITCTARASGTRVHVHQGGSGRPLAVDLTGLTQASAAPVAPGEGVDGAAR